MTELWGLVVALAGVFITLATIIYNAGKQSAKIDALEEFRRETNADLKVIRGLVENISGAISARKVVP